MSNQINMTIQEVFNLYIEDRAIYFDNGNGPSRNWHNIRSGLKPFVESVGHKMMTELDAPMLAALRDEWVREAKLVRGTINRRLDYITRMVKWCVERGYSNTHQLIGITTVERLARGRYGARDNAPIRSACKDDVQRVMNELSTPLRDMIEMMQLTGMRPGEARLMKLTDLKRSTYEGKPVFKYTLKNHKTSHLGKRRRVFLAGRAFDLAVERISTLAGETLFDPVTEGYLFSPGNDGKKPYSESSVPQGVRRARERLGCPDGHQTSCGTDTQPNQSQRECSCH
jgi:integrase